MHLVVSSSIYYFKEALVRAGQQGCTIKASSTDYNLDSTTWKAGGAVWESLAVIVLWIETQIMVNDCWSVVEGS